MAQRARLVTLPEAVLRAILAGPHVSGLLYGRRRDDGDLLQVRGLSPDDGEQLGRWARSADAVEALDDGVVLLVVEPGGASSVAAYAGAEGMAELLDCQVIRLQTDYTARLKGLFESDVLRRASVAVIGLGSGGSLAAAQLARCGVGRLHLVDYDRLAVENVARHACGIDDIGRHKTRAVADLLRGISPLVEVVTWEADILARPAALAAAVQGCDLVIGAVDSEPAKLAINRLCWPQGLPVVYGAAYNRAFGGDVFRAIPPEGACYECLHAAMSGMFAPPPTAAEDFSPAYADPTRVQDLVAEPGMIVDVMLIATLLARAAVATLLRATGSLADMPGNWTLFGNRPEWVFQRPLESIFVPIERRADCPVCNYESYARLTLGMTVEEARAAAARLLDAIAEVHDGGSPE